MSQSPPPLYFRVRENGAVVFRVDTENRQGRLDLIELATANTRNGSIKPHGDMVLTEAETRAVADWMATRVEILAERDVDDILRAVDHLNLTAQWVHSRASDGDLDRITDALLMAMHDLRLVLVRKKSERLAKAAPRDQA